MRSEVCELVHNHLRSSGTEYGSRRAQAMTQRPAKRMPQWLTIDLLVIVVSLAIIGIFIAIEGYLDNAMVGVGWQPIDKRP
jgi:hypothetical protein